jgi:hypothetical protein
MENIQAKITGEAICYVLIDFRGNVKKYIANDSSENICIGGYDRNGQYQQYDSYEGYHIHSWNEKHGFNIKTFPIPFNFNIDESLPI